LRPKRVQRDGLAGVKGALSHLPVKYLIQESEGIYTCSPHSPSSFSPLPILSLPPLNPSSFPREKSCPGLWKNHPVVWLHGNSFIINIKNNIARGS
jgi:hypothetical protein